jgi:tetratricopeptide (TPR) repeat protein
MPDLLAQYARIPDYAGVSAACAEPLSDLGREGIALFNAGEFYEAHHGLEAAWMEDQGAGRDFYRAILQIAVAYYQIQRGNYNGAVKMFLRVRKWLEPLPDVCRGVDVARLRRDADDVYTALMALGRDEIGRFDTARFQPVHFVDAPA